MPQPEILSSEIVYQGYFNIRLDHLKLPHGPELHYTSLITGHDAAVILAETEDNKLIILNEYRHPTGEWLLGCPGGRIDENEDSLIGAQRELLEETGYQSNEWILMGSIFPLPGICPQKIHYYLAKNARFVQAPKLDEFEFIHPVLKTKTELYHEIANGALTDGILCTALLLRSLISYFTPCVSFPS
jgi:ADP-ribose pyrophosphatase